MVSPQLWRCRTSYQVLPPVRVDVMPIKSTQLSGRYRVGSASCTPVSKGGAFGCSFPLFCQHRKGAAGGAGCNCIFDKRVSVNTYKEKPQTTVPSGSVKTISTVHPSADANSAMFFSVKFPRDILLHRFCGV